MTRKDFDGAAETGEASSLAVAVDEFFAWLSLGLSHRRLGQVQTNHDELRHGKMHC